LSSFIWLSAAKRSILSTFTSRDILTWNFASPATFSEIKVANLLVIYLQELTSNSGTGESVQFAVVVEFLTGADFEWKPLSKENILSVAKLFARNHRIPQSEAKMKHDFCYQAWPWNTRAIGDHFNDPMWSKAREVIGDYISK
jgi:hypothetical protein